MTSHLKKCRHILLLSVLLLSRAQAAELGEMTVRSYIGQPLVVDIELTALTPDDATGLQVRLASPDVYRGANISMHPALAALHMTIMQRERRQFLHITSLQAIDASYVHLFLELSSSGRQSVRAATVWLSADPKPAAPMPPPPPPPPVAVISHAMPSKSMDRASAAPVKLRLLREPRPVAACAPQSSEQVKACAALDADNAALNLKIGVLEKKVTGLQVALAMGKEESNANAPQAVKPVEKKSANGSAMMIALSAGAAALLLIGFGVLWYLKVAMPAAPYRFWVLLRKRLQRKAIPDAVAEEELPARSQEAIPVAKK